MLITFYITAMLRQCKLTSWARNFCSKGLTIHKVRAIFLHKIETFTMFVAGLIIMLLMFNRTALMRQCYIVGKLEHEIFQAPF